MDRIWHFLADRDPALAYRTERAIRAGADRLTAFPSAGRPNAHLGIRELSLTDLQYRIGYKIQDDTIMVTSVRSTREAA